jgi:hypothetical protein
MTNVTDHRQQDFIMILSTFAQLMSSAMSNGVEHKLSGSNVKLSQFLSASAELENAWDGQYNSVKRSSAPCTFPCLQLKGHLSGSGQANQDISLLDVAAINLASPLNINRTTIDTVPTQLLENVTASFQQLLSSRLRASMIALISQTMKLGDNTEAETLRRLLQSSKLIEITTVVTSFAVLNDDSGASSTGSITRPIVFETIIDANMLGKMHTVTLQAPGTISAVVSNTDFLLQSVQVAFDTVAFLKTMMEQARLLVKKTMRRAAKITAAHAQLKRKRARPGGEEQSGSQPQPRPEISKARSKDQDLLTSYPDHLRETVRQFLPSEEAMADASVEGYPPELARTLKLLANGGHEDEGSGSEEDCIGSANESAPLPCGEDPTGSLRHGPSTWMEDPSVNSRVPMANAAPLSLAFSSTDNFSGPRPLKKRRTKVSFSIPNHH